MLGFILGLFLVFSLPFTFSLPSLADEAPVSYTDNPGTPQSEPQEETKPASPSPKETKQEEAKPAEQSKPASPKTIKWGDLQFNGFLSGSYSYNFNKPDNGLNQLRAFDFDDNTFKVDAVQLVVQQPVSKAKDVGFRVDAYGGSSIPRVIASSGLFRDSVTGVAEDFDLKQFYVSYIADIGNGLRFDVGKFITNHGAEVIPGYDGYNDNATGSLLFTWAIPFTHTGIKATYNFSDKVTLMGMVINGWDNVKDNNRAKTLCGQLVITPASNLTFYLNYITGPERNGNDNDERNLFDAVAVWKPTSKMSFYVNYDNAVDRNAIAAGDDAKWAGFAAYARFDLTKKLYITFRQEWFNDHDGFRTGRIQKLQEFTFTPTYKLNDNFLVRGDLRFDHSNQAVFQKGSSFVNNQPTVFLNAIYLF